MKVIDKESLVHFSYYMKKFVEEEEFCVQSLHFMIPATHEAPHPPFPYPPCLELKIIFCIHSTSFKHIFLMCSKC